MGHRGTAVLVSPPLTAEEQAGSMRQIANVIPPLGLAYVAASAEHIGFDVKIIDAPQGKVDLKDVVELCVKHEPDVIGVTATILTIFCAQQLSNMLRERLPDTKLVLGGPMLTSMPEQSMEDGSFDCGVLGEGEEPFAALCEQAVSGQWKPLDLPGIICKVDGEWQKTPRPPLIKSLDELPKPAWHLLPPLDSYRPMPAGFKRVPMASMVTSRGCPFQCVYCDQSVYGHRFRANTPERVVDEIEFLINEYGAREVKFYDDIFNIQEKRVMAICDEIKRRNVDITWSCSCRVDLLTPEACKAMVEAGCWQIDLGLETGNAAILESMNKRLTLEQSRKGVKIAQDAGLSVRSFFIVGMPTETMESMNDSLDFAIELDLDVVTFYALMVYPGNDLFNGLYEAGKLRHLDFSKFTSVIDVRDTPLHYVPDDLTEEQIKGFIVHAYRRFYLRPRYVWKRLRSIRSWEDLSFYMKAGLMVLGL